MQILALSDQESNFIYQERFPDNFPNLDLIVLAGDLRASYVEYVATKATVPVVYVHGNHRNEYATDEYGEKLPPGGVIPIHGKIINVAGVTIAGWGGCPKYKDGSAGHYEEYEARWQFLKWWPKLKVGQARGKTVDILLTHAPPPGPSAGDDYAHRGSEALASFHRWYKPKLHVHGHVHPYESNPNREHVTENGTRVVNAFGYTLIDFPTP